MTQTDVFIFDRPKFGCVRDVKEFEYISMLMQTDKFVRSNGTITAKDISLLLLSRHGIQIHENDLYELNIIQDLSGDPTRRNKCVLDIPQLVSLLLIPKLKIAASASDDAYSDAEALGKEDSNDDDSFIFEYVLNIILKDIKSLTKNKGGKEQQED